jgi:aryl-alcohol dehydrogenase-like predicted oxidoreductase
VNSNSEKEKLNTINCVKVAYDHGVNFFDTAEIYGRLSSELGFG